MSVVVGYVPDATGNLAVTEAVRQAGWRDTDLIVVNAVVQAGYTTPTAADEKDLDALEARLAAAGVPHAVRHVDLTGRSSASDEILRVAKEVGAELIVVGLRRRSAVAKALLGSNAQRILLEADCPVLAVRSPIA